MEDEQLREIAQLLVKNAIEKAVDKIKTKTGEMDGGLDQGVDDIVGLTIGRSINAIREGQSSPTDSKMEVMLGLNKTLVIATPEVTSRTTGSKPLEIEDEQIKPSVGGNDNKPHIFTSNPIKDDKPTGLKIGHVAGTDAQVSSKGSHMKNVLERFFDRILKRDKKQAKEVNAATAGGSTNTSVGEKKKSSSKAHNKRDWIRRNLLCCFVRQTATVEPLFD
ncbi:uncharacterized protein LOC110467380 [Mizuhopecten yessoensis]|nr:uncharacterized protein LOC110467380 [Mizuhopecten yessoensis]